MIKLEKIDYKRVFQKFIWKDLTSFCSIPYTPRSMILNNCPKQFDTIKSLSQESLRINKYHD